MSPSRADLALAGPLDLIAGVTAAGEEIRLRPFRSSDVPAIVEACRDPLTQQYTVVPIPYDESNALEFMELMRANWASGTSFGLAIATGDGRYAGSADLRGGPAVAEIGYAVAPWARGRGIGTVAIRRLCEWGFAELGLARIDWQANVGNWASRRLAERVGFGYEGTCRQRIAARGVRYDSWLGGLLPSDLATGRTESAEELAVAAAIEGERTLLTYAVRGSAEKLTGWLDPEFREIGASGREWSRAEIIEELLGDASGREGAILDFEMRGELVAPDLVQLSYVSDAAGRRARRTSLWRRRDDRWQVVFHQGTRLP